MNIVRPLYNGIPHNNITFATTYFPRPEGVILCVPIFYIRYLPGNNVVRQECEQRYSQILLQLHI